MLSPGAEAFWLIAEDLDQDPLTYGISGPNAYFFAVTSNTGEVKLASPLDYEVKDMEVPGSQHPSGGCPAVLSPREGAYLGPLSPPTADTLLVHSHHLRERR